MTMRVQAYSSWYVPQRDSEETSMDPTTTFCPNMACPARGRSGQGNIGIHSRKDQRFMCTECHKTFSATKGTVFYRLRTSAETVSLVVTLLAHGCPLQAIIVALGYDGQDPLVAGRRGQRAARHAPDPAPDGAGEALCGTASPVGLYRWLGVLHPGHSGDFSRSHTHGHRRTTPTASVAPCLDRPSRQALGAPASGRHGTPYCRWHTGTGGDASTPVARGRGDQYGLH